MISKYIQLTKPTIIILVAVTGLATMAAEGSLYRNPIAMLLALAAIILSAGSANSLNQFIDRDIDSIMDRTRKKRPLPMLQLSPRKALIFGIALGLISNTFLWVWFGALTALLSIGTILFYLFIYTLWLKRSHHYNIVIGGIAGSTAPLIASAAATGKISNLAWILFLFIFMWTPPHFWALALAIKDQYAAVNIPMLPNVLGDRRTRIEIVIYTILLLPLSLAPYFLHQAGIFFSILAVLLWLWYIKETWIGLRAQTVKSYKKLFFVSIIYLFLIFIAIGLDGALHYFAGAT